MSYSVTNPNRETSIALPASAISVQVNSAVAAACLFITLSTSIPTPNAVTPFKSLTAHKFEVKPSSFSSKETERDDLKAIARIRTLGTYKAGWAGPESIRPGRNTVEHAEEFARYIFSLGKIDVPYISASSDGEINFYWKRDEFMLDLGFTGNGFYSYYAQLHNGQEIIEDGACLTQELPEEIINLLVQKA